MTPAARFRLVALAFALLAALRIAATWTVFSQTNDEGAHVAAGMEWLDRGRYTYEAHHPPLARIANALGPYLDGVRAMGQPDMWAEGRELLHVRGRYARNLALARAGALPFFLLAALAAWWWGRRAGDERTGALAVLLLGLTPPVLAHGGLATNDMAAAAMVPLALLAFVRWVERGTGASAALFGAVAALAALAKFSALPFLAALAPAALLLHRRSSDAPSSQPPPDRAPLVRPWLAQLAIAMGVGALVVWAGYRFSITMVGGIPVPAEEFVRGLVELAAHDEDGHAGYLLGEVRKTGWWYYFPVALAVKTPIALLLLALAGTALAFRAAARRDARLAVLASAIMLAVAMSSSINIGVRHLLPLFPFLCVTAAVALCAAWDAGAGQRRIAGRAAAVALVAWLAMDGVRAHPDYLAWFNPLAGRHPERVLSDSNLDWGQDLYRLRDAIARRGIDSISIACFGSGQLARMTEADVRTLVPFRRTTGWIAVSETRLADVYNVRPGAYRWLEPLTPVERVGRTIRLYHVPPEAGERASAR